MTDRGVRPSPLRRLIGDLLETVLCIVTLCIGWLVWLAITARNGRSPAKSLLKMRIHDVRTGKPASTGRVWLREAGWKAGIPALISVLIGLAVGEGPGGALLTLYHLVGALSVVIDSEQRAIWDHLSGTEVRKSERISRTFETWHGQESPEDLFPSRRTPPL